jgi:hypothetical protein
MGNCGVPTDHDLTLRRVVDEVLGDAASVVYSKDSKSGVHEARLKSFQREGTDVGLRVSTHWVGAQIYDLGVGAVIVGEEDENWPREAALRGLALVLRAYSLGEGRVETRKSWIRRRPEPVFCVEIGGDEWMLGRRVSAGPF